MSGPIYHAKRWWAIVILTFSTCSLVGCAGGGDDKATSEWMASYCNSGDAIRTALSQTNDLLRNRLKLGSPSEEIKTLLTGRLRLTSEIVTDDTNRLSTRGVPPVDQGADIASRASTSFSEAGKKVAALQTRASAMPTGNLEPFLAEVKALSEGIAALSRGLAGTYDEIARQPHFDQVANAMDSDDLFGAQAACEKLRTVRAEPPA